MVFISFQMIILSCCVLICSRFHSTGIKTSDLFCLKCIVTAKIDTLWHRKNTAALFFFLIQNQRNENIDNDIRIEDTALTRFTMWSPQLPTNYWTHSGCAQMFEVWCTAMCESMAHLLFKPVFVICRFGSFVFSVYKRYTNNYIEATNAFLFCTRACIELYIYTHFSIVSYECIQVNVHRLSSVYARALCAYLLYVCENIIVFFLLSLLRLALFVCVSCIEFFKPRPEIDLIGCYSIAHVQRSESGSSFERKKSREREKKRRKHTKS